MTQQQRDAMVWGLLLSLVLSGCGGGGGENAGAGGVDIPVLVTEPPPMPARFANERLDSAGAESAGASLNWLKIEANATGDVITRWVGRGDQLGIWYHLRSRGSASWTEARHWNDPNKAFIGTTDFAAPASTLHDDGTATVVWRNDIAATLEAAVIKDGALIEQRQLARTGRPYVTTGAPNGHAALAALWGERNDEKGFRIFAAAYAVGTDWTVTEVPKLSDEDRERGLTERMLVPDAQRIAELNDGTQVYVWTFGITTALHYNVWTPATGWSDSIPLMRERSVYNTVYALSPHFEAGAVTVVSYQVAPFDQELRIKAATFDGQRFDEPQDIDVIPSSADRSTEESNLRLAATPGGDALASYDNRAVWRINGVWRPPDALAEPGEIPRIALNARGEALAAWTHDDGFDVSQIKVSYASSAKPTWSPPAVLLDADADSTITEGTVADFDVAIDAQDDFYCLWLEVNRDPERNPAEPRQVLWVTSGPVSALANDDG